MNSEEFSMCVKKLSPAQDEESIQYWKYFADQCTWYGQSPGPEAMEDESAAAEGWLGVLYDSFCIIKESFGRDVADVLIGLGSESCCLYPGEMMQAAVCLENGGSAEQIIAMTGLGYITAPVLFSTVSREEAEKQFAAGMEMLQQNEFLSEPQADEDVEAEEMER